MLYFPKWLISLILGICALGVIVSLPNAFSPKSVDAWPRWIPKKQVSLGLDLRGGSYLLYEIDMNSALHDRLDTVVDGLRAELNKAKIGYSGGLAVTDDHITLTLREPERIDDVRAVIRKIDVKLDIVTGAQGVVTLKYGDVALRRNKWINEKRKM